MDKQTSEEVWLDEVQRKFFTEQKATQNQGNVVVSLTIGRIVS